MTNLDEKKPREFYINFGTSMGASVRTKDQFFQDKFPRCPDYQAKAIHVIEFEAFKKEQDKVCEFLASIKKYKDWLFTCPQCSLSEPTDYVPCYCEQQMNATNNLLKDCEVFLEKYGESI